MPNITNIPAPRVALIDQRTGLMAREWYLYFANLQNLTGQGSNPVAINDILIGPDSGNDVSQQVTELSKDIQALALRPATDTAVAPDLILQLQQQITEIEKNLQSLSLRPTYEPFDTTHVVASYGGMGKTTPLVIGALGAAFVTITNYDVQKLTPNINVTSNLVAGALTILRPSAYSIVVEISFTCTSLNAGRNFFIRLYDIAGAAPVSSQLAIYVGRDTDGGSSVVIQTAMITQFYTGKQLGIQIGGGDSFSAFTVTNVSYVVYGIGT